MTDVQEDELRAAFRAIASNVAIITTIGPAGPHGCTATAWAEDARSPYVVSALNKQSATRKHIANSRRFAASVLAADQAAVARRFAQRRDRFERLPYTLGRLGLALIEGAVVAAECELEASYDFGTYDLLVGRIDSIRHRAGVPVLTFCDGRFGTHVPTGGS